ncbi:Inherit from COG: Hemolysin-type calcium-binding [Seminavis robusta]|uniref:Inherit from COG: Hemolysin-type calcium-binding n=1 Tax=Seminavis robusta TaxID=568900 RepID=A0A9N8DBA8_9STRA|nr:Inherit from COG: Hemolysin-type calcium-binding [Seminavis robusta]|eukprot:Sro67_g037640.1 Inherit from COG: Hemolysin-type calcium-binding (633) ;mRNA; f:89577-91475
MEPASTTLAQSEDMNSSMPEDSVPESSAMAKSLEDLHQQLEELHQQVDQKGMLRSVEPPTNDEGRSAVDPQSLPGAYAESAFRRGSNPQPRRRSSYNSCVGSSSGHQEESTSSSRETGVQQHENTIATSHDDEEAATATLVNAELAPADYEDIVAERDELRQKMDSIPEAKALPQRKKISVWIWVVSVVVLVAALIVAIYVSVTATGLDDTASTTKENNTHLNDPFWTSKKLGQTLTGVENFDEFGESLALSGNGQTVAVGGEEAVEFRGRVVVYRLDDSHQPEWQQLGSEIVGDMQGDESGRVTLASSGKTLAIGGIGAWTEGGGDKAGRVRTYRLREEDGQEATWEPFGQVIEGTHASERVGMDVQFSADGSILSVGAPGAVETNRTGMDVGAARVFRYNETTDRWDKMGQELHGIKELDFFGHMTALSEDGLVLAAGGYGFDANGERSGVVRVYDFDAQSSLWKQRGPDFYGENTKDEVGRSISLSSDGRTIAFGAFKHNNGTGRVYVHHWEDSGEWKQMGQPVDGFKEGDRLGRSVYLSGDGSVMAIGAVWNDDVGVRGGHVRVFQWNSNATNESWEQVGPPIRGNANEWFGRRISISRDGTTLAIGGPFHLNPAGAKVGKVEVYSLP